MKIADQLDPMIIDGSVTHHVWQHKLNDAHHSKVRRVIGMTFQNPLAFKEVENAIEENMKFAQEKGKKLLFGESFLNHQVDQNTLSHMILIH